jgi:hypothetical protein
LKNLKEKDHPEDLGVDGSKKIRTDLSVIGLYVVDWMHLAQDRSQWWAPVNTVNELSGSIKGR